MGFCGRCGEPVKTAARCAACGGTSKTPTSNKVLGDRAVTPDNDRWSRQYVSKSPATTPKHAPKTTTNDAQTASRAQGNVSRNNTQHLKLPGSVARAPSSSARSNGIVSALPVEQFEETINRAFGSVLDPINKRTKWSCASCSGLFVRDQTVYPDPRAKQDASLKDKLYCPGCFADHFSLGDCVACHGSVLPDAATPFIHRKDKLWHSTCYSCLYCTKDLSKSPQVDLYGNPCCASCFDNAAFLKSPTLETVPALLSADEPSPPPVAQDSDPRKDKNLKFIAPGASRLGPAVNELRAKLERAVLEEAPASSPSPTKSHFTAPSFGRTMSEQPARPTWQRHQSSKSLTIPAAFSQPASPVLPSSPVMQSEAPKSTPLPQGRFPRPERTGRSRSLFDVPSISQLRPVAAESPNPIRPVADSASVLEKPTHNRFIAPVSPSKRPLPTPPAAAKEAPEQPKAAKLSASHPRKVAAAPQPPAEDSRCSGCNLRLFRTGDGSRLDAVAGPNKIITIPSSKESYHARCFTCSSCKKQFEDGVFVELDDGKKVHERCAPPKKLDFPKAPAVIAKMPVPSKPQDGKPTGTARPFRTSISSSALGQQYTSAAQMQPFSPSKIQIRYPATSTAPSKLSKASEIFASRSSKQPSPTFGGMFHCAGCGSPGSMAETTLGPVGTRFHHRCLKCACGKKLDSGAKSLEVPVPGGGTKRKFACRDCIDKDRLAKRSLSAATGLAALRAI